MGGTISARPRRAGARLGVGFSVSIVVGYWRASKLTDGWRTKSVKSIWHVKAHEQTGVRLPEVATNKIPPKRVDPGRTRACNLWFRRPTPYPLGHRTTCQWPDFVYMLGNSKKRAKHGWLNTGQECDPLMFRQIVRTRRFRHGPVGLGRALELDFRSSLLSATGKQAS